MPPMMEKCKMPCLFLDAVDRVAADGEPVVYEGNDLNAEDEDLGIGPSGAKSENGQKRPLINHPNNSTNRA